MKRAVMFHLQAERGNEACAVIMPLAFLAGVLRTSFLGGLTCGSWDRWWWLPRFDPEKSQGAAVPILLRRGLPRM